MSDVDTDKLPTAVREQDLPVGGAAEGQLPALAVNTVPVGIGLVREVPTLRATATSWVQPSAAGSAPYRIGAEPLRRALHVSVGPNASATAYAVVATTQEQAAAGLGYLLTPGGRVTVHTAEMLWIAAVGADLTCSFLAELDQG